MGIYKYGLKETFVTNYNKAKGRAAIKYNAELAKELAARPS